jgi:hypothetical protein
MPAGTAMLENLFAFFWGSREHHIGSASRFYNT